MAVRIQFCLLLVLLGGIPLSAQDQEENVYRSVVPVVGQTTGLADVTWHTELAMTNPHRDEITVGLTLMGGGEPFFLTTLAPGQSMAMGELVGSVLGEPGVVSVLEVASMGSGPVSVGIRVLGYKDGEFVSSQAVPVYGQSMPFAIQRLDNLAVNEQFRTNIGLANSGDEDATVILSLQRIDGRAFASAQISVGARSLVRAPLRRIFPLLTEGSDLTVIAEASTSEVIAFASVVSNSTQSARFIAPAAGLPPEDSPPTAPVDEGANR